MNEDENNRVNIKAGSLKVVSFEDEQKIKYDNLYSKILAELNTDSKYKIFFDKYKPSGVDGFKQRFAHRKTLYTLHGEYDLQREDEIASMYYDIASEKIWEIQQRKLFDLQCKWRAEQIVIPEIDISHTFEKWGEHIKNCPFLTSITQEEFDMYMAFIQISPYDDIFERVEDWQDYEGYKEWNFTWDRYDCVAPDIPEWYQFYESRTGMGTLYLLPDIRGEKEEFYISLKRKKWKQEFEEKNKEKPEFKTNEAPLLFFNEENILKFMEKFENPELFYYEKTNQKYEDIEHDEEFKKAILILQTACEPVEVEDNIHWRRGIIQAANEYTKKRLIEELPKAYDNYLLRIKNGIFFNEEEEILRDKWHFDLEEMIRNDILDGREINGEQRDFNF
ncbi:MAG: hypothetical protein M1480_19065 [Bacteroidetes bacterium]|nr:hypothetical protein [Bacteroidota bacterium]